METNPENHTKIVELEDFKKTQILLPREEEEKWNKEEEKEALQNTFGKIGTQVNIPPLIFDHLMDISGEEGINYKKALQELKEKINIIKDINPSRLEVSKKTIINDPDINTIITSLIKEANDNLSEKVALDIFAPQKGQYVFKTTNNKLIYLSPPNPAKDGLRSDMSGYQLTPEGLIPVVIKISTPDKNLESEIKTLGEENKEKIVFTDNKSVIITKEETTPITNG